MMRILQNNIIENNNNEEENKEKKKIKELKQELSIEYKNLWDIATEEERDLAFSFADDYKSFLDIAKTEREYVKATIERLEELGFANLDEIDTIKPGMKVYKNVKGKGLMAAVIGKLPLVKGMNLIGAHVDAPRLDLKPNPLYEENDLVLLKTHYYGGIKKYQWAAVPLALHGVVFLKDGSSIDISIGEAEDDPVFTVTDLLPHLGAEQMSRKATEVIKGEDLNVLAGGIPYPNKETNGRFKLAILQLLKKRYGITERDLVTAEIEVVPAHKARDVGFDGAFVGAYGQDDRVCAYPAVCALSGLDSVEKTAVCLLFDKEEIGSDGNTGAQSKIYEYILYELYAKSILAEKTPSTLDFHQVLLKSSLLSADVTNAFDPTYASVSDPRNNSYINKGITLVKYVGSRGKYGTSDANGEFFARVSRLFDAKGIHWQTGEMGKVDAGGGGTIAKYLAHLGMEVIDCGVPVLSMHSTFEITGKIDIYNTYLAYQTFLRDLK